MFSVSPSVRAVAIQSLPLRVNTTAPMLFLLENHVALNRLRGLVFPQLLDAIGAREVLADHFEHDDRIVGDDGIRIRSVCT